MLKRADFWKEEREAPLLRLNCSFLPSTDILQRIESSDEDDSTKSFDHERIIRLDAERTFLGATQRTTLMNILSFLRNDFGCYHQAMSYVVGFLVLTHSPSKVIELMGKLHRDVLVGYWTEEPVAFATDAYVFDYLLADRYPDVHEHLSKHHILPETYAQKWFTTLCVGVLPFKALFLFFDTYVTESILTSSNVFLFQFALSLIKHMRENILKTKNISTIYGYLRLDMTLPPLDKQFDELTMSIVRDAKDYDLSQSDFNLLRKKAFEEKLRARLEAAKRAHQENEKNQISCSTSSSDDDNDDGEEENLEEKMKTLIFHMKQLHIE